MCGRSARCRAPRTGVAASAQEMGEGAEDGDLFRARGAKIFLQECAGVLVETGAGGCHHVLDVAADLCLRVDATDLESVDGAVERLFEMRRRIGGRQLDRMAASRELDRNRRGERRLADPALAHHQDEALPVRRQLVHQRRERRGRSDVCPLTAVAGGIGRSRRAQLREVASLLPPSNGRSGT